MTRGRIVDTSWWTLEELDLLHEAAGLGDEWKRSERRAELAASGRVSWSEEEFRN